MSASLVEFRPDEFGTVEGGVPLPESMKDVPLVDKRLIPAPTFETITPPGSLFSLVRLLHFLDETPRLKTVEKDPVRALVVLAEEAFFQVNTYRSDCTPALIEAVEQFDFEGLIAE